MIAERGDERDELVRILMREHNGLGVSMENGATGIDYVDSPTDLPTHGKCRTSEGGRHTIAFVREKGERDIVLLDQLRVIFSTVWTDRVDVGPKFFEGFDRIPIVADLIHAGRRKTARKKYEERRPVPITIGKLNCIACVILKGEIRSLLSNDQAFADRLIVSIKLVENALYLGV